MRKHIAKRVASVVLSAAMVATLVPANMMVQQDVIIAEAASMSYSSSYKSGKYYTALTKVKLTGNPRTDIVNIAKSQIGYQEGGSSSKLSGTVRGNANCTEYGRWYGMQDMWCAMFVSWCAAVAGIPSSVVPKHAYTPTGLAQFRNQGRAWSRAQVAAGKYRPQAGDIIYFKSSRNQNTTNHIGIVTGYSNGTVYTVEGNTSSATVSTNGGAVAAKSYSINNTYIVYICQPKYSGTGSSGSAGNGTSVNTGSTSSSSTLKQGSEGEAVKSLQRNLIGLGYLNDVADGQFGSKTLAAVKSYQKAKGLTVDGLAGTQTKNALNADVKSVQSGVYKLGFTSVGSADGDYGSNTKAAVKMFQSKNGLSATGIADAATRAKISQLVGSASGTTSNPSSGSTGTTTAAGNVSSSDMAVIRKIIYAVETGGQVYGNARYDDFTPAYKNSSIEHAITIGAGQWYATEAQRLLKLIRTTDPATFKSLDTAGIGSDLDNKSWSTYRVATGSAKAKCIQKIISTSVGKKCQDKLVEDQMITYMKEAYKLGVTDLAAQMMCANFRHQGGTGAMKRVVAKTAKPYTLDNLYKACSTDTGNQVGAYKSRQKMVYNALKKYIGDGKKGVTSSGSVTNTTTSSSSGTTTKPSTTTTTKPSTTTTTKPSTTNTTTTVSNKFKTNQTLKSGSKGTQVKYLQYGLVGLGYSKDAVDGAYGSKTKAAVIKFQKARGLSADGIAGVKTLTAMKNRVVSIQKKLKSAGYYSGTIDGIYGSGTKTAVKSYQKAKKLSVDGIAGPKTLGKMGI